MAPFAAGWGGLAPFRRPLRRSRLSPPSPLSPLSRLFRLSRRGLLAFALAAAAGAGAAYAAEAAPEADAVAVQAREAAHRHWQAELATFDAADRSAMPPPGGVVFVGSSTIRFWSRLAQDFPEQPVIVNRGFGGSTMAESAALACDLVVRYRPRLVVVYAGDNDLAEGRSPLQVLESFASFANTVRGALPEARIAFVSVKPSPSREKLLPQIRETNHMIEAYLKRLPNSDYIDVYTPMLGADGRTRPELFRPDMLHMNDEGYRLWRGLIGPHLAAPG